MPSKARAPRATASPRPLSAAKRKKLATQQLLSNLTGDNEAAAVTAALEVANEWLAWDTSFQERLRQKYAELSSLSSSKKKDSVDLGPAPVPIAGRGLKNYSPYGKFDPYQLIDEYGRQQLRAVLVRATQQHLREAVAIVQAHEPGTKPANRSNNTAMIDYIVAAVAGPDY